MRFEGKVAIITAAGAGIGRATTEIIVREGGTVVAVENQQARLDAMAQALANQPGKVVPMCIDAMDEAQAKQAVQDVADRFGHIDILVNAVGGSTIIPKPDVNIDEMPFDDWQKILNFNLSATFHFINAAVPHMKAQKSGKIVNLASIAGRSISEISNLHYSTAKAAILGFTRKLAYEEAPNGIGINCVAPGTVFTDRVRTRYEALPDEEQRMRMEEIPMKRAARPEEIAAGILFLASDDASYITGACLDVNGGRWMG